MGLKHKAKKGTVIEVNGVTITVLRGSPRLEITAPPEVPIKTCCVDLGTDIGPRGHTNRPARRDVCEVIDECLNDEAV